MTGGGAAGPPSPIASPCIGICRLDAAGATCTGCHRTLADIAAWPNADAAERHAILARAAARRSD